MSSVEGNVADKKFGLENEMYGLSDGGNKRNLKQVYSEK